PPALNDKTANPSKRTWNSASECDRCADDIGTLLLLSLPAWCMTAWPLATARIVPRPRGQSAMNELHACMHDLLRIPGKWPRQEPWVSFKARLNHTTR